MRDYLLKLRQIFLKVIKNTLALFRACCVNVLLDKVFELNDIVLLLDLREKYHFLVESCVKVSVLVKNVSYTA